MVGRNQRRHQKMRKETMLEEVLDFMIDKGEFLDFRHYESYKREVPHPARKVRAMFGAWSNIKKQAAKIYPEKWALIDPNVEVTPPPAPEPAQPSIQEAMAAAEEKEETGELSGTARPADGVFG